MSTIKSSAENLTLNADGANNDIKFQSNGSEVASIDQAGVMTATSFAGSGANLTGTFNPDGAVTINESGADVDFRVESDTHTHALFVDGAKGNIGLNVVPASDWSESGGLLAFGPQGHLHCDGGGGVWLSSNYKNVSGSGDRYIAANEASRLNQNNGIFTFQTAASGSADAAITWITAMNINNTGKVGIGETADVNYGLKVKNNVVASSLETTSGTGSHEALIINRTGSDGWMIAFNRDGSTKGGIVQSGSSTAFNTSSDYRLKENVDYTWDATTRLKQLKPARFNFIEDETNTLVDGFLAHEAATVVPEAITGTKDAMKDEEYEVTPAVMDGETVVTEAVMGTRSVPDMQGIDQSKLVPLLVKTIQELEARITALEA